MTPIKVYGAYWCDDTQHTREQLDLMGIPYEYHDVDVDARARAWVKEHNEGQQKTPTLEVNGDVISVPKNSELERILRAKGIVV